VKADAAFSLDEDQSSLLNTEESAAKPRIQSAVRTISILLAVADSPNGLKAKQIMEKLGLSRQVTYHLIHTMHGTGIIRKNESNRYVLGLAAVSIAEGFGRQLAPPEHLGRRVRSIVAATGETAYAGGWVGGEIVALATARGESPVGAAQVPQGFSGYAHARAAGKLLLAMVDASTREAYLAKHPLHPRTARTITNFDDLTQEFERIRSQGYSIDHEEFHEGLQCMAVPVEGLGGRFVVGSSVPKQRFDENFERYLAALRKIARING
jgi:IclR family transcriptional regulator, acetate operon repressor